MTIFRGQVRSLTGLLGLRRSASLGLAAEGLIHLQAIDKLDRAGNGTGRLSC